MMRGMRRKHEIGDDDKIHHKHGDRWMMVAGDSEWTMKRGDVNVKWGALG